MIQKKVCMVGAFATGKTSLVARFVKGIYSDKYQTTIGVKIDKKVVETGANPLTMVLWDIYGEDEFQNIRMSYLRGAAGYLLVVDGTRRETLDIAIQLQAKVEDHIGPVPFIVMLNKCDLEASWEITPADLEALAQRGWKMIKSSAKEDQGVQDAFAHLAQQMTGAPAKSQEAA